MAAAVAAGFAISVVPAHAAAPTSSVSSVNGLGARTADVNGLDVNGLDSALVNGLAVQRQDVNGLGARPGDVNGLGVNGLDVHTADVNGL